MKRYFLTFLFGIFLSISVAPVYATYEAAQISTDATIKKLVEIFNDQNKIIQGDKDVSDGFKRIQLWIQSGQLIDYKTLAKSIYSDIALELDPLERNRFMNFTIQHIKEFYWNKVKPFPGTVAYETRLLDSKPSVEVVLKQDAKVLSTLVFDMKKEYGQWRSSNISIDGENLKTYFIEDYKKALAKDGWDSLLKHMERTVKLF